MTAQGRSSRWRTRRLLRRTLRVFQRHYGSLATLAVLTVALVVALTSSSFTGRAAGDGTNAPAPPASRVQLPPGFRTDIPPAGDTRVTYYLYEDEDQRALLSDILRRDFTAMTRMGLPNYIGEVNFLRVTNELEEDYAYFLINEIAAWAKTSRLTVSIVDLR